MKKNLSLTLLSILFITKLYSQSITLDKNKVMDFFQAQQYEDAINYLYPLQFYTPLNVEVLKNLGYAYYMNDDETNAEKCFQKVITLDSNNVAALQYLVTIYKGRKTDESFELIKKLISLQPGKALYKRQLAELFQRAGNKDSALFYFNQAYQISPNDPKNALGFGWALIEEKDFNRVDSIAENFLAKDSMNIYFLKLKITAAYESRNYQNAIVPGERLIKQNDLSIGALTRLAISYFNLNMYNECIRTCSYMDSNQIADESVYFYEAKSKAKLKDFKGSNDLLQTCLSLAISKKAELYYYTLAENNQLTKQFKKAASDYDTAYYLFKNPVMLYNNGNIYEIYVDNEPLAAKYYRQYLKNAKPENADEKKAYEYVRRKLKQGKSRK
ncbi:MAG: tetratricopeptide repeat protein [Bacteroidetes bacterium]|nr:tetratricopeptide repeat protein [Bacteroidota bacterium]